MTKFQSLKGKLLIAMPSIEDGIFEKSVVFLCAHERKGAMGFVINKPAPQAIFSELVERLKIDKPAADFMQLPVMYGGPVEKHRGFVLHSSDYKSKDTFEVSDGFAMTGTTDILKDIAEGRGPLSRILTIGHSGWDEGQLDREMLRNGWLHCDATPELVFGSMAPLMHDAALSTLGVSSAMLSAEAGRA